MKMSIFRGLCALLLSLTLLCSHPATAGSGHEEATVRQTYARLSHAVQLKALYEAATATDDETEINKRVSDAATHFTIADAKTGDLADVGSINYGDLVTKPNGAEALSIGIHSVNVGASAESTLAGTPEWITEPILQEDWNVPMSKAVPAIEQQNGGVHLQRYCTYTVTVSFVGKSRTYNAMFLFGKDASGNEVVVPLDMVVNVNGQALVFFTSHEIRTDALTHAHVKNAKAVAKWIASHPEGAQ